MKKLISSIITLLMLSATVFAQAPESFNYQAVARDASGEVIANQAVSLQISILQGSTSGTAVYTETHIDSTNQFGLVTLEIGTGTTTDDFTGIDWSSDVYLIQIEIDATGGTSYTEMGTSQLLSVPYALHAKTVKSITEIDPEFTAWDKSSGISITESQISDLDYFTNADETDPVFGSSVANGITVTDTTNWNNKLNSYTETDPIFGTSVAGGITGVDTTNWNNKLDSYTEAQNLADVITISNSANAQIKNVTDPTDNQDAATKAYVDNLESQIVALEDMLVESGLYTVKFIYNGNEVTYGVVKYNDRLWLDRNLGATQVATAFDDSESYGDLFQWGREDDGHQVRTSVTTATLATAQQQPGHDNFILTGSQPYDWNADSGWTTRWVDGSGNKTTADPCPDGWRVPTQTEWQSAIDFESWGNSDDAFNSALKLPSAGTRDCNIGTLGYEGNYGRYWSSTPYDDYGYRLSFGSSSANVLGDMRSFGFSVRCIKD